MGAFYGSIHVRTEDRTTVVDAAEKLARRQKTAMLVGPMIRGWIAVYPAGNGQDERISGLLAKRLPGDVLHLIVHDDDLFTYTYYHDGKVADRYNSCPDYFAPVSDRMRARLRGRPERLAHLLPDPARLTDLRDLFAGAAGPGVTFASRHLERFAELLDIANAAEAYEYLREQDGEGVDGWAQFTHVPDLSEERGRELARAAEQARATQRLRDEGVLRHVESRPGKNKEFSCTPYYCPDGANGFLVFWFDWQAGERRPVEHYLPPWASPGRPTGIDLEPTVTCLARGPSGRYLAVAHAYGGGNARLWHLAGGRPIRDVPHDRSVVWVGFSPDESLLVTLGIQDCLITRTDTGERVGGPVIQNGKVATVHPDGTLVVGDQTGHLHLVDLSTGGIRKRLLVGDRADMDAMRQMQRAAFGSMLRSWNDPESQRQSEALIQQMEAEAQRMASGDAEGTGFRIDVAQIRQQVEAMRVSVAQQRAALDSGGPPQQGTETPAALALSGDGRWLAVGTSRGVRVYAWDAVRAASDYLPQPAARYDSLAGPYGGETNYVYAVAWHAAGPGVFFGGTDGRIDYLDVATGAHRMLCELPGRVGMLDQLARIQRPPYEVSGGTAVLSLGLSSDGSSLACCVQPDLLSRHAVRKPPELMIWDCAALLRR
jgi:WD40 repeat protein